MVPRSWSRTIIYFPWGNECGLAKIGLTYLTCNRMATLSHRLNTLQLHPDVRKKADEKYHQLPSSLQFKKNINLIAYLVVSEAYRSLGVVFDPESLETSLGVSKTNNILKKAAREGFDLVLHKYRPHDFMLPSKAAGDGDFLGKMGIKADHLSEIEEYLDKVLEAHPELHEKNPRHIAAGVIAYYATKNGYDYDKELFSTNTGVSCSIIKDVKKIVSKSVFPIKRTSMVPLEGTAARDQL